MAHHLWFFNSNSSIQTKLKIFTTYFRLAIFALVFLPIIESCEKQPVDPPAPKPQGELELINLIDLNITEPSGLSFGPANATLLIVSDNTNKVYETDLQGDIIRELPYVGFDLEGVTYNPTKNIIAVTEERKREVVLMDYTSGDELGAYPIDVEVNNENSGLEGISYSHTNQAYYIVNEQLPGVLIVWNPQHGIINSRTLNFADDYSAIFVDTKNSLLWIVSDQSQTLYQTDYNANVLKEYPLDRSKYEGITIDVDNNLLYLVNDATFELSIYKILN
jgi:uncharacterized protein YjiK